MVKDILNEAEWNLVPEDVWRQAYGDLSVEDCTSLTKEFADLLKLLKGWYLESPRSDPRTHWLQESAQLPTSDAVRLILRLFPQDRSLREQRVASYCSAPAHDGELLAANERSLRGLCATHGASSTIHLSDRYGRGRTERPSWAYLWQLAEEASIDVLVLRSIDHIPGPDHEWVVVTRQLEDLGIRIYVSDDSEGSLRLIPAPSTAWQWLQCA